MKESAPNNKNIPCRLQEQKEKGNDSSSKQHHTTHYAKKDGEPITCLQTMWEKKWSQPLVINLQRPTL